MRARQSRNSDRQPLIDEKHSNKPDQTANKQRRAQHDRITQVGIRRHIRQEPIRPIAIRFSLRLGAFTRTSHNEHSITHSMFSIRCPCTGRWLLPASSPIAPDAREIGASAAIRSLIVLVGGFRHPMPPQLCHHDHRPSPNHGQPAPLKGGPEPKPAASGKRPPHARIAIEGHRFEEHPQDSA